MLPGKVDAPAVSFGFLRPSNEFLGHLTRENGNIAYCKSHNIISSKSRGYYNKTAAFVHGGFKSPLELDQCWRAA